MINKIDVVMDLSRGDCCKKQVSYSLMSRQEYTHSMRVNGSQNSGGTVVYRDKNDILQKIVLQMLPSGILLNKKCIIGQGCVVNLKKFFKEIENIESLGFNVKNNIFVYKNTHVITDSHIEEEKNESKIGTTKQGVGPAYRDKFARTGKRICDVYNDYKEQFLKYEIKLIDPYKFFYESNVNINLLVEMAQGFYLDIDSDDYPYVTSSNTTIGAISSNYLPFKKIEKIYGCIKAYNTYVGSKQFQPLNEPIFNELADLGNEFGSVTGRRRQCNWMNIDEVQKALNINCVTHLIVSKLDVLSELNKKHNDAFWNLYSSKTNTIHSLKTKKNFVTEVQRLCASVQFRSSVIDMVYI